MQKTDTFVISLTNSPGPLTAAADILRNGGVALIPTETVYGICAHPRRPAAVRRLYEFKGRDIDKPLQLLISDISAVERLAYGVSPGARRLMHSFWPGPLTIILPALAGGTIGLRMPDHPAALQLIKLCGGALWATSANFSGLPETTDFPSAMRLFDGLVDAAIDGGTCFRRAASTVVSFTGANPAVFREGAISKNDVARLTRQFMA